MMNQTSFKKSLTVKELATVGIFSALFLTLGIFFALNPALTVCQQVARCCEERCICS